MEGNISPRRVRTQQ